MNSAERLFFRGVVKTFAVLSLFLPCGCAWLPAACGLAVFDLVSLIGKSSLWYLYLDQTIHRYSVGFVFRWFYQHTPALQERRSQGADSTFSNRRWLLLQRRAIAGYDQQELQRLHHRMNFLHRDTASVGRTAQAYPGCSDHGLMTLTFQIAQLRQLDRGSCAVRSAIWPRRGNQCNLFSAALRQETLLWATSFKIDDNQAPRRTIRVECRVTDCQSCRRFRQGGPLDDSAAPDRPLRDMSVRGERDAELLGELSRDSLMANSHVSYRVSPHPGRKA